MFDLSCQLTAVERAPYPPPPPKLSSYDETLLADFKAQIASSVVPTRDVIGSITPKYAVLLLQILTDLLDQTDEITEGEAHWVFTVLLRLDSLQAMEEGVAWNLQVLRRNCERIRESLEVTNISTGRLIARLNLLITLISMYFNQR